MEENDEVVPGERSLPILSAHYHLFEVFLFTQHSRWHPRGVARPPTCTSSPAGQPCALRPRQRSWTILDPRSGHCGKACVRFCHRWLSVPLTSNRERRLHPYGLHQDREEGAGSPPASSCLFPSSQLFLQGMLTLGIKHPLGRFRDEGRLSETSPTRGRYDLLRLDSPITGI
jgi:hypothetical protein